MGFLLRPVSLILVILLSFLLKVLGLFTEEDAKGITKIALTVTIPAAIFCSFESYRREAQLIWTAVLMFLITALSVLLSFFLYRKQGTSARAFAMINGAGYNIGSFALPIIQNFYGSSGVMIACMADLGNAIIVNGGAYALTVSLLSPGSKSHLTWRGFLLDVGKRLLHSPPFICYIVLIPCIILNLRIPSVVVELLQPIASANSFVCMSMVGLSIGAHVKGEACRAMLPILTQRLLYGALTAAAVYFLLPFSEEVRQVLALVCLAPIPGLAVFTTGLCHGDVERSGLAVSLSILTGTVCLLALSVFFQQI